MKAVDLIAQRLQQLTGEVGEEQSELEQRERSGVCTTTIHCAEFKVKFKLKYRSHYLNIDQYLYQRWYRYHQ